MKGKPIEKKPKTGKNFFDQNVEMTVPCPHCKKDVKIVRRVWGKKKVITPAVAAQVEIEVGSEPVATLNDFGDEKVRERAEKATSKKKDEDPED